MTMTAPHPAGLNSCGCEGGWMLVTATYVERRHPLPQQPELGAHEDDYRRYDAQVAQVERRRAASTNTVYPCRACRPDDFARWAGGHLDPDHNRHDCPDCIGGRRTRTLDRVTHPAQRADVDG